MCKFLYHYSPFDSLEKIIQSKKFRMGSSLTMNDPTDRCFGTCFFSKYIQSDAPLANEIRGDVSPEQAVQIAFKGIKQPYYTVSFAKIPNNLCLLNRYAEHGQGIVFELNIEQFEKSVSCVINKIDNEGFTAVDFPIFQEVQYGEKNNFIENIINEVMDKEKPIISGICATQQEKSELLIAYIAYLVSGVIKDSFWKDEEEIRLLFKYDFREYNSKINDLKIFENNAKRNIYKTFGLLKEITENEKSFLNFNLDVFWNCRLVNKIYTSKERKEEAEKILKKYGLDFVEVRSINQK